MSVGSICNRDVIVVERDESAQAAAELMRTHHVGDVVVVEGVTDGRVPVGIVTDRDLVVEVLARGADAAALAVGDLLIGELRTAREDEDPMEALGRMRSAGVRRMPVVDAQGALIGILALDDMLALLAEQMADIARLVGRQVEIEARARS